MKYRQQLPWAKEIFMCAWAPCVLLPQYIHPLWENGLDFAFMFYAKLNWGPIVLKTKQGYCQINNREMLCDSHQYVGLVNQEENWRRHQEEWMLATGLVSKWGREQRRWNLAHRWCAYSEAKSTSLHKGKLFINCKVPRDQLDHFTKKSAHFSENTLWGVWSSVALRF